MEKNYRNTSSKDVLTAWKLFYEQEYDHAAGEEIAEDSKISKSSFCRYFSGKNMFFGMLCTLLDDKYEELMDEVPQETDIFEKPMYLNRKLFRMIEDTVPIEWATTLCSS